LSTLYIRVVAEPDANVAPQWTSLRFPFALVSHGSAIERQGSASLKELSTTIATVQRVVLLLAASDVTILHMHVPPLPQAKLGTALPNLVEEHILMDPDACLVVAGGPSNGLRTIAVAKRAWIELLTTTLRTLGASRIEALPSQLCLPLPDKPGTLTAAIDVHADSTQPGGIGLAVRFPEQDAIGLQIIPEKTESAPDAAIRTISALVPNGRVTLYVPETSVGDYEAAIKNAVAVNERFSIVADNWGLWIMGARAAALDLMSGLTKGRPLLEWRTWRWPAAMAVAVLAVNVISLNVDWWQMKREATTLRASMIGTYKSAYPKESVIVDPIAQMRQKITIAKHNAGLSEPDDFTQIVAAFGDAWNSVAPALAKSAGIGQIDYRDRSLYVTLKPGSEMPTQSMREALAKHGLALESGPRQSGAAVWQIRGVK
jgi:general secretion pathway protein L